MMQGTRSMRTTRQALAASGRPSASVAAWVPSGDLGSCFATAELGEAQPTQSMTAPSPGVLATSAEWLDDPSIKLIWRSA